MTFSLSLFSVFFISSLLHNSLSLSHHISLSRWAYFGVGSVWVWWRRGLLKLADDGL